MATTKVEVKIFDEYYPLRIEGDDIRYIEQLAAMLDERLRRVAGTKHRLSRARVAVVTALQIADEYCHLHGEKVELEKAQAEHAAAKQEESQTDGAWKIEKQKIITAKVALENEKLELQAKVEQLTRENASLQVEKVNGASRADAMISIQDELEELKLKYSELTAERDALVIANADLNNKNKQLTAELAEAKLTTGVDAGLQMKYDILSKAHAKLKDDYSEMMEIIGELS